jgi:serine/threonine-protein kinase
MNEPFGHYTLLRPIGTGGMAEVFLARSERTDDDSPQVVALKRLLPHLSRNPEIARQLLSEERIAARLDHAHIAHIYDLGHVDERAFIAMELVLGPDLARLAERCVGPPARALGMGTVVRLILDVCDALHHAHEARDERAQPLGIVHGDIHPRNVMVTLDGVTKVIDFGVAQATSIAADAQPRGTYAYMAPEQLRGEGLRRECDVFATGALLWELVAGRSLFGRSANYLTLAAAVEDAVPTLASSLPDEAAPAAAAVDDILAGALAKRAEDRIPTNAALARDLAAIADRHGWDVSPAALVTAVTRCFGSERARLDDAVATSGRSTAAAWLAALSDQDIGWLLGG